MMQTLYLVRHGRAAAGWDADPDPGLDGLGREQAERAAQRLAPLGPLPLLVSPLARTRATAAPLARSWGAEPRIEPRVGEIPTPMQDLKARGQWLRTIATQRWSEVDETLQRWRRELLEALGARDRDTVVVTHFAAINAAVGAATGDDRVVGFRPDYCSITTLRAQPGRLVLLERGAQARTRVL